MEIVIGDIHGNYLTLLALLKKLPADAKIFVVGDLIDRGPRSKEVVDFMIAHPEIKCVQGNHEKMFLDTLDNKMYAMDDFLHNGGDKTLASYGLQVNRFIDIPEEHENYIRSLPLFIETDNLIISHSADIRDNWSRSFSVFPLDTTKFHVFGHTPLKKALFTRKYCCIDTGCFLKKTKGCNGRLSAVQYPGKKLYEQENID